MGGQSGALYSVVTRCYLFLASTPTGQTRMQTPQTCSHPDRPSFFPILRCCSSQAFLSTFRPPLRAFAGHARMHLSQSMQKSFSNLLSGVRSTSVMTETRRILAPYFGERSRLFLPNTPRPACSPACLCEMSPFIRLRSYGGDAG